MIRNKLKESCFHAFVLFSCPNRFEDGGEVGVQGFQDL
jgi:hypothetical protein